MHAVHVCAAQAAAGSHVDLATSLARKRIESTSAKPAIQALANRRRTQRSPGAVQRPGLRL